MAGFDSSGITIFSLSFMLYGAVIVHIVAIGDFFLWEKPGSLSHVSPFRDVFDRPMRIKTILITLIRVRAHHEAFLRCLMKSCQFPMVLAPVALIAHVSVVWFSYFVALRYCDLTPDSAIIHRACVKTAILAIWLPGALYLVRFLYSAICRGPCHFYSFYYPVIEEILKLCYCAAIATVAGKHTAAVQLPLAVFILNSVLLLSLLPSLSLTGYYERYKLFLDLHSKWLRYTAAKVDSCVETRKASVVLDNILALQNKDDRKGSDTVVLIDSFTSSQSSCNMAVSDLPQSFSVSCQSCDGKSPEHHQMCAAPMQRTETSHNTIRSVRSIGTFQSSYDVIDQLYSVSPKNTFHLDIHAASAIHEPVYPSSTTMHPTFIDDMPDSIPSSDPLVTVVDVEDFERDSVRPFPNSGTVSPQPAAIPAVDATNSRVVNALGWFSWLVPPLFSSDGHASPVVSPYESDTFPLLKSRLSQYSIAPLLGGSRYGSVDLESNRTRDTRVPLAVQSGLLQRGFDSFRYFACFHYDYSPNIGHDHSLEIDPLFVRFGQLLTDMPVWYIALDVGTSLLWSAISLIVYAILVHRWFSRGMGCTVLVVFGVIVFRLFSLNYLHGHVKPIPYKALILLDFSLTIIAALAIVVYLH